MAKYALEVVVDRSYFEKPGDKGRYHYEAKTILHPFRTGSKNIRKAASLELERYLGESGEKLVAANFYRLTHRRKVPVVPGIFRRRPI